MQTPTVRCGASTMSVLVALLVGCGGSPPLPGVGPEKTTDASPLHSQKPGTLLYASGVQPGAKQLYVFSFPDVKYIGKVAVPQQPFGLCTDTKGDVFVTTEIPHSDSSDVYEYAHGGTQPITTLEDPGQGWGCAVDPATGDLAVTNFNGAGTGPGNVAVYQNAKGTPKLYADSNIVDYYWCAYDSKGDLFVDGINSKQAHPFAELPKGASAFDDVKLNKKIAPGSLQWLGNDLLVVDDKSSSGPEKLYRVHFSGSEGTVVGITRLVSRHDMNSWGGEYVVSGENVVGPSYPRRFLSVWSYPKGGDARVYVPRKGVKDFLGVAVSAPQ